MEFFTGSYDLAAFGESLIPFGEAMSSYGAAVAGIDAGAVTNSATAGQALVELANTLPNEEFHDASHIRKNRLELSQRFGRSGGCSNSLCIDSGAVGGVMEFFTGGNDLATFAATIVPFGAAMKS